MKTLSRRSLAIYAIAISGAASLCGAGKYTDPDAISTERAAQEALSRAKVLAIVGMTSDLSSVIKDLGARVTDTQIQIEIPSDVLFDFDKSEIRPDAAATLKKVAQLIQAHPGTPVRIEGHTDALGSDAHNFPLSERRAVSVKQYLVKDGGVEPSRLTTVGLGKTKPVAANTKPDGSDNPEGRQKNRRVSITIQTKS